MFPAKSLPDVIQSVNTEFLEKIPSIRGNYNGSALLRTYVSAVIRNICLQLCEDGTYSVMSVDLPVGEKWNPPAPVIDRYSVAQARKVYRAIMNQFGRDLPKLLICLKLRYHIGLQEKDILRWYPECNPHLVSQMLRRLGPNSPRLTSKEIYAFVTPIFNLAENTRNSSWAVRRWTLRCVEEIIILLNSSIPEASFDDTTLKILIEDYFCPFLLKE